MDGAAENRLYDLARLRLRDARLLTLADERALLSRALLDLGIGLDDARGVVLRAAADAGGLVESVERARVERFLKASVGDGGRLAIDDQRHAALLAAPWLRAAGRSGDAAEVVREIAATQGARRFGRWSWAALLPGPRAWWTASPTLQGLPNASKAAWRAVR